MEKQASCQDRSGLYLGEENRQVTKGAIKEIIQTAKKYLKKPISQISVLDVGSGTGNYSHEISKNVKKVVGVEPFKEGYTQSIKKYGKNKKLQFHHARIEEFKTKEKFDLIIALTVLEHMENQKKAFQKIFSLLQKDGVVYITAPNKYWLFEQHYGLPFLSWLPLPIANKYLELTKGIKSYKDCSYSLSYMQTIKFLKQFTPNVHFVLPFDENSSYLNCGHKKPIYSFVKTVGIKLIHFHPFFWNFSKGFIIVAKHANNPKN